MKIGTTLMRVSMLLAFVTLLPAMACAQQVIGGGVTIGGLPAAGTPLNCTEVVAAWQNSKAVNIPIGLTGAACQSPSAPSSPKAGQYWFNTTTSSWALNQYDGAQWVSIGTLNTTAHSWTPTGAGSTPCITTANSLQYNNAGAFGCVPLGLSTQVFHGNASGLGTWAAVALASDVSGTLPAANGGTGCAGLTGSASSSTFLRGDCSWATPAGSGNVTGPGSAVSGNIATYNGTSGTIIQDGGIAASSLATLTGTQTLTNKTLTAPTLTSPTVTGAFTATGLVTNADLANSSMTIAGHSVSLGGTQTLACADLTGFGTGCSATIANYAPLAGATFTGKVVTVLSATGGAGFNLPHGAAPTSPVNGDLWTTTSGLFARINGSTVGPYGTGAGSSWNLTDGTTTITGVASVTVGAPFVVGGTGTAATLGVSYTNNPQTGTTYTFLNTDSSKIVTASNAASQTYTLPGSTTTNFTAGYDTALCNIGAGVATAASVSTFVVGAPGLAKGQCAEFTSLGASGWLVQNVTLPFMGADTVLGNPSGSAAWPAAMALTTCPNLADAVAYSTSTHAWGCNSGTPVAITISTATFTPAGTSRHYTIALSSACPCTLANPSAVPPAGTEGTFKIVQDGTGSRTITTWGSDYIIEGGVSGITLSTGANAIDTFAYHVFDSTHILLTFASKGASH